MQEGHTVIPASGGEQKAKLAQVTLNLQRTRRAQLQVIKRQGSSVPPSEELGKRSPFFINFKNI